HQSTTCERVVTSSHCESRDRLDRPLQRAQPVQLVAAVLPSCGGRDTELGGNRTMFEQYGFHSGRLSNLAREAVSGRRDDEGGWMVVDCPGVSRKGEAHAKTSDHGDGGKLHSSARAVAYVLCDGHATQERRPSRVPQRQGQPVAPSSELERLPVLLCGDFFR